MSNKRLRYFDGQFLQDEDFIDEQEYHLDRERRPFKCLAVAGVCEGLTVDASQADQVTVAPGMAVDPQGRQLVLELSETVGLRSKRPNPGETNLLVLLIAYDEIATDQAVKGSRGYRRWYEQPQLLTAEVNDSRPTGAVRLAQLTIEEDGAITVDSNYCEYSGLSLPNGNSQETTLRYQWHSSRSKAYPTVSGDLKIAGDVILDQTLEVGEDVTFKGDLTVHDEMTISGTGTSSIAGNVGIGTTAPSTQLHVVGTAKITGNTTIEGILSLGSEAQASITSSTTALEVNTTIRANKFIGEGAFVAGMILMWSGKIHQVPIGWVLCNGQTINGTTTPDLQGRFIVGYETDNEEYGRLGNTGGEKEVTLTHDTMPKHQHSSKPENSQNANTCSTSSAGTHQHLIEGTDANGTIERARTIAGDTTVSMGWGGNHNPDPGGVHYRGYANTDYSDNHTHTYKFDFETTESGGSKSHENRPPYYVLAYIIKI